MHSTRCISPKTTRLRLCLQIQAVLHISIESKRIWHQIWPSLWAVGVKTTAQWPGSIRIQVAKVIATTNRLCIFQTFLTTKEAINQVRVQVQLQTSITVANAKRLMIRIASLLIVWIIFASGLGLMEIFKSGNLRMQNVDARNLRSPNMISVANAKHLMTWIASLSIVWSTNVSGHGLTMILTNGSQKMLNVDANMPSLFFRSSTAIFLMSSHSFSEQTILDFP